MNMGKGCFIEAPFFILYINKVQKNKQTFYNFFSFEKMLKNRHGRKINLLLKKNWI